MTGVMSELVLVYTCACPHHDFLHTWEASWVHVSPVHLQSQDLRAARYAWCMPRCMHQVAWHMPSVWHPSCIARPCQCVPSLKCVSGSCNKVCK